MFKVLRKADGQLYALKKVKLGSMSSKERENAINEVRILASIKHPNVIQYKEAFVDSSSKCLCIIMEYAEDGDVFQKILRHQKERTYIKERQIWKILIHTVWGLHAMHAINVMHRDLKSANIFLMEEEALAKLGDMNVSKVTNSLGLNYTQTGTPYYASPEVWRDEPYNNKSDVWSLGCCFYELLRVLSDLNGGPSCRENRIMIPGEYCYPLSPRNKESVYNKEDQMTLTLQQLGAPDAEDLSFVTTADARKYLCMSTK